VRVGAFFAELQRNSVISAVRGPVSAPSGARRYARGCVRVRGDIFQGLERVKAAGRRPRCVSTWLIGGVSADASGLRFLSGRIEGVISTHRHAVQLARETDLLTIYRLFVIDSGAVERG
jgi:glycerol uptake operon antiterminator